MQYSPKLKKAIAEIEEVIAKHDIAAVVVLHTPGHSEFIIRISPSYSCATVDGDKLRIRAKLTEFNGDKKALEKTVTNTSNMLNVLANTMGKTSLTLLDVSEHLDKHVGAMHTDGGESFHTTQNN